MRVLVPHQRRREEQPDGDGGEEQQPDDRAHFRLLRQRRPERAADKHQPQHQPDEQEPLPEAAHIGIFPALMPEPEIVLEPERLHHREPLPREGADHDDEKADPQEVDAEPLEARFVARYRCGPI